MSVGLYYLVNGISDKVCHDHEIRAVVQKHRDKGMSEIVISDTFDSCFFDIRIKSMGESIFVDRGISSEKKWCFALIVCQSRAQRGADRGISDLLVLRCRDLIGRTVKGFAAIGFIEEDRGGFDIRMGEGKNLSFSSTGKE